MEIMEVPITLLNITHISIMLKSIVKGLTNEIIKKGRSYALDVITNQKNVKKAEEALKENWQKLDDENNQSFTSKRVFISNQLDENESLLRNLRKDLREYEEDESLLQTIDNLEIKRESLYEELKNVKQQEAEAWSERQELEKVKRRAMQEQRKKEQALRDIAEGIKIEPRKYIRRKILKEDKEEEIGKAIEEITERKKELNMYKKELVLYLDVNPSEELEDRIESVSEELKSLDEDEEAFRKRIEEIRESPIRKIIKMDEEISKIEKTIKNPLSIIRGAITYYAKVQRELEEKEINDYIKEYETLMDNIGKDINPRPIEPDIAALRDLRMRLIELDKKRDWKIVVRHIEYFPKLDLPALEMKRRVARTRIERLINVLEKMEGKLMARDCDLLKQRLEIINNAWEKWKQIRKKINKIKRENDEYTIKRMQIVEILEEEVEKINGFLTLNVDETERNTFLRLKEKLEWEIEKVKGEWDKSARRIENITVELHKYPESIQNTRTKIYNEKSYIKGLLRKYCTGMDIDVEVNEIIEEVGELTNEQEKLLTEYKKEYEEIEELRRNEYNNVRKKIEEIRGEMEEDLNSKKYDKFEEVQEYRKEIEEIIEKTIDTAEVAYKICGDLLGDLQSQKWILESILADTAALILTYESTVITHKNRALWKEQGYTIYKNHIVWGKDRKAKSIFIGVPEIQTGKIFKTAHTHPMGTPQSVDDIKNIILYLLGSNLGIISSVKKGEIRIREMKRKTEEIEDTLRQEIGDFDVSERKSLLEKRINLLKEYDKATNEKRWVEDPKYAEDVWKKYAEKMGFETRVTTGNLEDVIIETLENSLKDLKRDIYFRKLEIVFQKIKQIKKEGEEYKEEVEAILHDLDVTKEYLKQVELISGSIKDFIDKELIEFKQIKEMIAKKTLEMEKIKEELLSDFENEIEILADYEENLNEIYNEFQRIYIPKK